MILIIKKRVKTTIIRFLSNKNRTKNKTNKLILQYLFIQAT